MEKIQDGRLSVIKRRNIPSMTIVITLACMIGVMAGLILRNDVIKRYREELLRLGS